MEGSITLANAPIPGAVTDRGAVGKPNEDSYGYFKLGPGQWADEPARSIYVALVADGVTSKAGGAKASEIAVTTITQTLQAQAQFLTTASPHVLHQSVEEAIIRANEEIRKVARQTPEWSGMSTTLVLAVLAGRELAIAHLGDSRAYLIRGDEIHRLTVDHTWIQEALDQQQISAETAKVHPNRNVIQRYLGIRDHIEIDYRVIEPGTYALGRQRNYVSSIVLEPGDVILLCSDGQVEKVADEEILAAVSANQNQPQKAAAKLIQLALAQKEQDNITSLLLALPGKRTGAVNYTRWGVSLAAVFMLAVFLIWFIDSALSNTKPTPVSSQALTSEITATLTLAPREISQAKIITTPLPSPTPSPAAQPTATAAATATPIPLPTDTNAPAPTATLLPATTVPPTSTPLPTRTATATNTATATHAATRTPLPTITALSNAGKLAAPPTGGDLTAQLLLPPDKDSGQGERIFSWLSDLQPGQGQAFEVVFWKDNPKDAFGIAPPTTEQQVKVNLNPLYDQGSLQRGEYKWAVLLVKVEPYTRIKQLSGANRFFFEPPVKQEGKGSSGGTSGQKDR